MAELPVEEMSGVYKRQDGTVVMTKDQKSRLEYRKVVEKQGMLVVTTFCHKDIPILRKRLEWMAFLQVKPTHDLLLVADYDVASDDIEEIKEGHKSFFRTVELRNIKQSPTIAMWPHNVNAAFRKTVRILWGQYGEPFSWIKWTGWFNYESDVTLLVSDAIPKLEAIYRAGNKPFAGYFNETRLKGGTLVRHLNGAAIYPTRKDNEAMRYNKDMMLNDSLPWDVVGMKDFILTISTRIDSDKYAHFFSTRDYRKEGEEFVCTQTLMDDTSSEKRWNKKDQILHHGCKDGSLINILMGKTKQSMTETKIEEVKAPVEIKDIVTPQDGIEHLVRADKANGMKWTQLISKYKLSPKKLKAILG